MFEYKGKIYPEYIKNGNAAKFIFPFAEHFCDGEGLDIGGLKECHLPGAIIINKLYKDDKFNAFNLPQINQQNRGGWDYIFSSHCLEHLEDYIIALEHWRDSLKINGRLFLYLPHPDMEYWRPENCRKHRHLFYPDDLKNCLETLNFRDILYSGRDFYWSFIITGIKK